MLREDAMSENEGRRLRGVFLGQWEKLGVAEEQAIYRAMVAKWQYDVFFLLRFLHFSQFPK